MIYLKRYNESSEETADFNSFLSNLDKLKEICDGQLANLYDDGFELDYHIGRLTFPKDGLMKSVSPSLHVQLVKKENWEMYSYTWKEVKDSFIPLLQLLSRRYVIYPRFDPRSDRLKMRQEDRIKVMLSTQVSFYIGNGNSHSAARSTEHKYFSLQDVLDDKVSLGKSIFSISIEIGGEL
jgi:hypothetical protein